MENNENNEGTSRSGLSPLERRKREDYAVILNWSSDDLKGPKRQEGETREDYKIRLRREKMWEKAYLEGQMVWLSKRIVQDKNGFYYNQGGGTYIKAIHGNLE